MRQATTNGDPVLPANCAIGASHSIWYTFTPSTSALYTFSTGFDTGTTAMDPILAVYTSAGGCAGPFVNFACNDDAGGPDNRAGITTNFNAGTTYYIVVWVSVGEDFTDPNRIVALQLLVTRPEIPVNDSCAGAEVISPSGPFPYSTAVTDTMRATTGSQVRPSCVTDPEQIPSRDVWYRFTPATTNSYVFSTGADTATTVSDTVMTIYTSVGGCNGPFAELQGGCNDNTLGRAAFSHVLDGGTQYYIVVWDNSPDPISGETRVQLRVSPATAPTAITLPATSISSTGAVLNGIVNNNGASDNGGRALARFWFEWGPTLAYGNSSQAKLMFAGSTTALTTNLPVGPVSGVFLPNTIYHFRMVATNSLGRTNGEDLTFVWSNTPPRITSPQRLASGSFRFQFTGNPGQLYEIQGSTNLGAVAAWTDLGLATNLSSTLFQYTHTGTAATPFRFYRVRLP